MQSHIPNLRRFSLPMRIGILAQPESYYLRELRRVAGSDEIVECSFGELRSELTDGRIGLFAGTHDLTQLDALIVRTMPPGSLEQVVFRMDQLAMLESVDVAVINPPKSLEAAVDKFLTSARLAAAGIPTPRTIVCQTWDAALEGFCALGGRAVVKPLFGGEGRGIFQVDDEEMMRRTAKMLAQLGGVIYLQQYVDHGGADLRILFVGDEHFVVRRSNPKDWRTNASRGAIATPVKPTQQQLDHARRAARVIAAPICGVDILSDAEGRDWVIEVNAVPGWKATANALGVDVAALVMNWVRRRAASRC